MPKPPPIPKRQHEVRHEPHLEGRQFVWSGLCPACQARNTVAKRVQQAGPPPSALTMDCGYCGELVTAPLQPAR